VIDAFFLKSSMDSSKPVPISFYRTPELSAVSQLRNSSRHKEAFSNITFESDLLRSIRASLHGLRSPESDSVPIHTLPYWSDELAAEEELTWDSYKLIISSGGVIRKKWDFTEGHQRIQWACIGYIDQPTSIVSMSSTSPARYTTDLHAGPPPSRSPSERSTFGPFATVQQEQKREVEFGSRPRAIYVFFRNMGKIFLTNGIEYTFNLPFVTRIAWPAFPHGVIIQRVLDPTEIEEANVSGDPPLPTIFSFTNPFAEVTAVGVTSQIIGGFHQVPVSLNALHPRDHEHITPQEVIVWVSQRGPQISDDIVLMLNPETRLMTVWRYAHLTVEKPVGGEVPDLVTGKDLLGSPRSVSSEMEVDRLRPCVWFEKLYQFHAPLEE
jgi:anaphase-promoting complex subunit 1